MELRHRGILELFPQHLRVGRKEKESPQLILEFHRPPWHSVLFGPPAPARCTLHRFPRSCRELFGCGSRLPLPKLGHAAWAVASPTISTNSQWLRSPDCGQDFDRLWAFLAIGL